MSVWFWKITTEQDGLSLIPDFIDHFEKEYQMGKGEIELKGSVENQAARIPGVVEHRFVQLQEIEAVLKWLHDQQKLVKGQKLRHYVEKYDKALSATTAEKYADSDSDVVTYGLLINQVALIRNKYLGLMKGLEYKHYQITNITKLRCAGLEDSEINF